MKIEVLEQGSMQSAITGWLNSRSMTDFVTPQEIAEIDASVNELPSALFHFQDFMIIEREIFTTFRNHVIWARTSRVDDPRKFTAPVAFTHEGHALVRNVMQQCADDGEPQDKWRMFLPIVAHTSWTARLTFRDAVRMSRYFMDVGQHIIKDNPKLAYRFAAAAGTINTATAKAFGVPTNILQECEAKFKPLPLRTIEPDLQEKVITKDFTDLRLLVPLALRAQLVRHREIIFVDDLLSQLRDPLILDQDINVPVRIHAVAHDDVWRAVLGKRTCWMAQSDLWAPVAAAFGQSTNGLPCADWQCPYAEDAKLRLLPGRDPGAPCPRFSNLTKTPMTAMQLEAAAREAASKSNPNLWADEISFVKMRPDNAAIECVHTRGCQTPRLCHDENHCDAKFNGYR